MASDGWAAALAAAPAAEQERLFRHAVFSEPWLAQWLYSAAQLARARSHLAAGAARLPSEFPGVCQVGSMYNWKFGHAGIQHRGSAESAREAALERDAAMQRLGLDKKHWTFSYDSVLPVLNSARVPRGSHGVNFELHAAAGLPPACSLDCQNPNSCPNRATKWYQAKLALCKLCYPYVTHRCHPGTHRTEEALAEGRAASAAAGFLRCAPDDYESSDDEAEEALDDAENDQTYCEQGAAKRCRVLIDDFVPDDVLAVCRPLMRQPRIAVAVAHLLQRRSDRSRKILHLLDALGAAIRTARSVAGAAGLTGRDFLACSEGLFTDPRDSTARPRRLFALDQEGPAGRPSSIAVSRLTRDADGRSTFRSCYVIFHLPRLYGAKNDDGSPGAQTYVALEANGCTMFPKHAMGNMVFLQYVRVFGTQVKPACGYAAALDAHELAGRTPCEHNLWGASELQRVMTPQPGETNILLHHAGSDPAAAMFVLRELLGADIPAGVEFVDLEPGARALRDSMIVPAGLQKRTPQWMKSSLQHLSFLVISRVASQSATLGMYFFGGHVTPLHSCQTDVGLTVLDGVEVADTLFSSERKRQREALPPQVLPPDATPLGIAPVRASAAAPRSISPSREAPPSVPSPLEEPRPAASPAPPALPAPPAPPAVVPASPPDLQRLAREAQKPKQLQL